MASSSFKAVCVASYFIERDTPGRLGFVHSVFGTSFNLEFDGCLVHVGGQEHSLSCLGMVVGSGDMAQLLSSLSRGDRAVLREGAVVVYARGVTLYIDYGEAEVVNTSIPRLATGWSPEVLLGALPKEDLRQGAGLPLGPSLEEALRVLSDIALGSNDLERAGRTVSCLLGRGMGLTPAGDDLLMGYGTALWARGWEDLLPELFEEAQGCTTTEVSLAYLRAMRTGNANEDYVGLVRSLDGGQEEALSAWIEDILSVGHTSGHDSLLGFVVGMGLLDNLSGRM